MLKIPQLRFIKHKSSLIFSGTGVALFQISTISKTIINQLTDSLAALITLSHSTPPLHEWKQENPVCLYCWQLKSKVSEQSREMNISSHLKYLLWVGVTTKMSQGLTYFPCSSPLDWLLRCCTVCICLLENI